MWCGVVCFGAFIVRLGIRTKVAYITYVHAADRGLRSAPVAGETGGVLSVLVVPQHGTEGAEVSLARHAGPAACATRRTVAEVARRGRHHWARLETRTALRELPVNQRCCGVL